MKKIMNKKTLYSIKDISRIAGFSTATVSNALNGTRYVKKETKELIKKIANELNYYPNVSARGLKAKTTNTIGIIIPDISNPFYSDVIKYCEVIAKENGYIIILACTYYDIKEEITTIEKFRKQLVDGIISFSGYDEANFYIKKVYEESKIPVVIASDNEEIYSKVPSIIADDKAAIEKGFSYLYDIGHRKIGFISYGSKIFKHVKNRYKGYVESLRHYKLEYIPEFVILSDDLFLNEIEVSYNLIRKNFKDKSSLPTAFLSGSDLIAIGIINALKDLKIKIPEEIAVIGFDDISISKYFNPRLTTLKQSTKTLGFKAMEILLDLIKGKKKKIKQIILPTELVIRESA